MRILLLLLALFVISLSSCTKELGFVEQINTATITNESTTLYNGILSINEGRNIVYVFDPSCSVCLAEYITFCKYASECLYDSLTTIVVNSKDMLLADFHLEKLNQQRPIHECVIYDTDKTISRAIYRISQGRNVLLFDNHKLAFSCNMQEYFKKDDK